MIYQKYIPWPIEKRGEEIKIKKIKFKTNKSFHDATNFKQLNFCYLSNAREKYLEKDHSKQSYVNFFEKFISRFKPS